jgi:hypothetical protein
MLKDALAKVLAQACLERSTLGGKNRHASVVPQLGT